MKRNVILINAFLIVFESNWHFIIASEYVFHIPFPELELIYLVAT
jgi:hypothetical protein